MNTILAVIGFMIHTFLRQQPTIYRKIIAKADGKLAEDVIQ